MTLWSFIRRDTDPVAIDASPIRRSFLAPSSEDAIRALTLICDGSRVALGDLFDVSVEDSPSDVIFVQGNLATVHGLAAEHDHGLYLIEGHCGNYVGCGMTGGRVIVKGNAAEFAAAPYGANKAGMSGGCLEILGDCGQYAGHRMRRGTLAIAGTTGDFLAASMIAGTIAVRHQVGARVAIAMRRGTLLLLSPGQPFIDETRLNTDRYSMPTRFDASFLSLFRKGTIAELTAGLDAKSLQRTRADRNTGGLGEILFPEVG